MTRVEELRAQRNATASAENIEEGKRLKAQLKGLETELAVLDISYEELLVKVPNPAATDVVVGPPEENQVIKTVGTPRQFDFPVRDHVELGALTRYYRHRSRHQGRTIGILLHQRSGCASRTRACPVRGAKS